MSNEYLTRCFIDLSIGSDRRIGLLSDDHQDKSGFDVTSPTRSIDRSSEASRSDFLETYDQRLVALGQTPLKNGCNFSQAIPDFS